MEDLVEDGLAGFGFNFFTGTCVTTTASFAEGGGAAALGFELFEASLADLFDG